ncbi:MAG: FAD:protein FMN transferase [Actinomycetota bacterium]
MPRIRRHRAERAPLLGTTVGVQVLGLRARAARAVAGAVFAEIARLEACCSVYRADSALERWKRAEITDPGPDVGALLGLALAHQQRWAGAFNPMVGEVRRLWAEAEATGVAPDDTTCAAVAHAIAAPRYRIGPTGMPEATGPLAGLEPNALAKGWIVDRAVACVRDDLGDATMIVDASGDLRHVGPVPVAVAVEDPRRGDGAAPLTPVTVADAGVATSGAARRGFTVAGRRHSHLLDPRTGRPADGVLAATVVAPDAATADVLATVCAVEPPERARALADDAGVAWLALDRDGTVHTNARWRALPTPGPP